MSRSVETSFSNTQDILNILTGSLLENEQDGEPVTFRNEQIFQATAWQMNGQIIYYSKSRLGACPLQQCMSSLTKFYVQVPGAFDPTSASKFLEQMAETLMKSDSCKNRSDCRGDD